MITPFHKRFFAWSIDLVLVIAYWWLISILYSFYTQNHPSEKTYWILIIAELPPMFYYLITEVTLNGQTIGKMAMGIQVISLEGGQPSFSQYLIRWIFRIIDFPVFIAVSISYGFLPWWCLGFLFTGIGCILLTPYSQRTGDLVAGTIIIDRKNRLSWEDTVFTELESDYQPHYPQVMQLSDKDLNTLKSIIEMVKKNSNYDLSMRIADRIRSKLNISGDQDSLDFLETLLKDYNYYTNG